MHQDVVMCVQEEYRVRTTLNGTCLVFHMVYLYHQFAINPRVFYSK